MNLVGHSLGAYLVAEIAYQMGGVDTITALEPATDVNRPREWDEARGVLVPIVEYSDGYAYQRRFENGRIGWVRPPMLPAFHQVSRFSRAFQGRSSSLGNVGAVAGAHEAIAVDFGYSALETPMSGPQQHGDIHLLFKDLVTGKLLTGGLFGAQDNQSHTEFAQNYFRSFDVSPTPEFEGVLLADPSKADANGEMRVNVLGFYAKGANSSGFLIYGRDTDDRIIISPREDDRPGIFMMNDRIVSDTTLLTPDNTYYLGAGNDQFQSLANQNDLIYGDFPEAEVETWQQRGWKLPEAATYDDTIEAGDGDDTVMGGLGSDTVKGGQGNDTLQGEDGDDYLYGEAEDDIITGDEGDDYIQGNQGEDQLYGGEGNDSLQGGEDRDILEGEQGDDVLYGDPDYNWILSTPNLAKLLLIQPKSPVVLALLSLRSQTTLDVLSGNMGMDLLEGGMGSDMLYGDDGDDRLYGDYARGDDARTPNQNQARVTENLLLVESLFIQPFNDLLYGGKGNDYLYGGIGDDQLYGEEDNDRLYGEVGTDRLYGEAGDDRLYGQDGTDYLYGGDGIDYLQGNKDSDYLYGGDGNDRILGGLDQDYLSGEDGDDHLSGHNGNDEIIGGKGNDRILGEVGSDKLYGGDGSDRLFGDVSDVAAETDPLKLVARNDVLYGEDGDDFLYGQDGDDYIEGGKDEDYIQGNEGNDELYGGLGDDRLMGGDGNDIVNGALASSRTLPALLNIRPGSREVDVLTGGGGTDRFILGDARSFYYLRSASLAEGGAIAGNTDHAVIADFNGNEGDRIQLHGNRENYAFRTRAGRTTVKTEIYHQPEQLDVVLLSDLSASFKSELNITKRWLPELVTTLKAGYSNMQFGVASFAGTNDVSLSRSRKYEWTIIGYGYPAHNIFEGPPIYDYVPVGWEPVERTLIYRDTNYIVNRSLSIDEQSIISTVEHLTTLEENRRWQTDDQGQYQHQSRDGEKESQLDVLYRLASDIETGGNPLGFRSQSTRVVLLTTDSEFTELGEKSITGEVLEGGISIAQLKGALLTANILPIFAVTRRVENTYQNVIDQLGFGAVIPLNAGAGIVQSTIDRSVLEMIGVVRNATLAQIEPNLSFV